MSETFSRFGLRITVHDNRVEVRDGIFPTMRKSVIPLGNIAGVEVTRLTKRLVITTNDGKAHSYAIGGFGKAQKCRDAIVERL